jgi:hypothetical protein
VSGHQNGTSGARQGSETHDQRRRPARPAGRLAGWLAVSALSGRGPFDLLFSDGGRGDDADLVAWLRIGGRIVMDDVTPQQALPPGSPLRTGDPKRSFFFADPRLVATEVVLPDLENSLLVGTRRS